MNIINYYLYYYYYFQSLAMFKITNLDFFIFLELKNFYINKIFSYNFQIRMFYLIFFNVK